MACTYQEGEKKGKPTGNMSVNFKLTWEKRDVTRLAPNVEYVLGSFFMAPLVAGPSHLCLIVGLFVSVNG